MFTLTPTIGARCGHSQTELSARDAAAVVAAGDPEWIEANTRAITELTAGEWREFAGPYGANWRVRRDA